MPLTFDRDFEPRHGQPVPVAPGVLRVTAANPGAYTFAGTNTYIVGESCVGVIDPGPDRDEHLRAILAAAGGRPITQIFVTHAHRDHSPLASRLQSATGAPVLAEGPPRSARPGRWSAVGSLDASSDTGFQPDRRLANGGRELCGDLTLRIVFTPGHAANHACYELEGSGVLFSGDHVMAWATSIVAPPDGHMGDYLASLQTVIERDDRILLPGHGGPVTRPRHYARGLKAHRLRREREVLGRVKAGEGRVVDIVENLYRGFPPELRAAARWMILSHLEHLVERRLVRAEGPLGLETRFVAA